MKSDYSKLSAQSRKTTLIILLFVFYCSFAAISKEQIYKVHQFKKELLGQDQEKNFPSEKNTYDVLFSDGLHSIHGSARETSLLTPHALNNNEGFTLNNSSPLKDLITESSNTNKRLGANEDVFDALEKQGQIGVFSEDEEDKISDNFFTINIPKQSEPIAAAYLTYDLFGLSGHESVPRSINQNPAVGGNLIEAKYAWSNQKESINLSLLKEGKNTILFTPPSAGIKYKVKNVKVVFERIPSLITS
ncbi:MAG: hypothetical protein JSS94_07645 [Bacteroidetes bacterium]|nr:hypothetical protein [Bacteroidota bacterium]